MFWREVGYGPTLIFLHGSWQDGSQWLPLLASLGQDFHCIAPDLLGFGESSSLTEGKYSVDLQVDCLAEYLKHLRIQPHILIADSVGAWIAVRYSLQYPEKIRGLILMAPEGLVHPTLEQRWRKIRWLASPWSARGWGLQLTMPFMKWLGGDRWLHRIWQQRQQFRRYQATCQLLFQRRRTALLAESLNDVLSDLDIPVLLLHPEQCSETTQLIHQLFQDLAPKTHRLAKIPGNESTAWQEALATIHTFAKTNAINSTLQ